MSYASTFAAVAIAIVASTSSVLAFDVAREEQWQDTTSYAPGAFYGTRSEAPRGYRAGAIPGNRDALAVTRAERRMIETQPRWYYHAPDSW